ncbi:MAG TPA: response regulator transcription factor [Stellaceae bacterium]|nr:response regulator transcription factor [Stellaceae bacterium]
MQAIVADDHPLFREAAGARLSRLLPGVAIAEAEDFAALRRLAAAGAAPDLVLVDLNMPGMEGADGIRRLVEAFPRAAVVLMSGLATETDVREAVRAGARGFLPKTIMPELFAQAVGIVLNGGTYLPVDAFERGAGGESRGAENRAGSVVQLTPREQQVLARLASGAPNKEIGRDLGLAEITVKLHVRQILKKIGARNRSEAVSIAIRNGVV